MTSKPSVLMFGDEYLSFMALQSLFASETIVAMSSSPTHLAFACSSGRAYTYGKSFYHEWSTSAALRPTPVAHLQDMHIDRVACGFHSTYFVEDDGSLYSCGFNGSGQLGLGNVTNSPIPLRVQDLPPVKKIVAGLFHVALLTEDGSIKVCGGNHSGQLGLGHRKYQDSFTTVENIADGVVDIACGAYHTALLTTSGRIFVAGRNRKYQLGITGDQCCHLFWQVTLLKTRVVAVACGAKHTIALTEDGCIWGWGSNKDGQLGTGKTGGRALPTRFRPSATVSAIFAGGQRTVLLTEDGDTFFYGRGLSNQPGDCIAEPSLISKPPELAGKQVAFTHDFFLLTVVWKETEKPPSPPSVNFTTEMTSPENKLDNSVPHQRSSLRYLECSVCFALQPFPSPHRNPGIRSTFVCNTCSET